jgi:hypothetical protein
MGDREIAFSLLYPHMRDNYWMSFFKKINRGNFTGLCNLTTLEKNPDTKECK